MLKKTPGSSMSIGCITPACAGGARLLEWRGRFRSPGGALDHQVALATSSLRGQRLPPSVHPIISPRCPRYIETTKKGPQSSSASSPTVARNCGDRHFGSAKDAFRACWTPYRWWSNYFRSVRNTLFARTSFSLIYDTDLQVRAPANRLQ